LLYGRIIIYKGLYITENIKGIIKGIFIITEEAVTKRYLLQVILSMLKQVAYSGFRTV
jgi:hypothetical protein